MGLCRDLSTAIQSCFPVRIRSSAFWLCLLLCSELSVITEQSMTYLGGRIETVSGGSVEGTCTQVRQQWVSGRCVGWG